MSDDTSQVTSKGQVTIPAKMREKFNLQKGKKILFVETEDGILIKPVIGNIKHLRGVLSDTNLDIVMDEIISDLRKEWRIEIG